MFVNDVIAQPGYRSLGLGLRLAKGVASPGKANPIRPAVEPVVAVSRVSAADRLFEDLERTTIVSLVQF